MVQQYSFYFDEYAHICTNNTNMGCFLISYNQGWFKV